MSLPETSCLGELRSKEGADGGRGWLTWNGPVSVLVPGPLVILAPTEILASRSPGKPQTLSSVRALAGTDVVSLMCIPSNLMRTVRLIWIY